MGRCLESLIRFFVRLSVPTKSFVYSSKSIIQELALNFKIEGARFDVQSDAK